jgi:hypothetical protein
MPTNNQGMPQLDKAIAVLGQLNLFLGGIPAAIALGAAIVQMVKSSGRSDEEAQAEVDKFNAAVQAASDFNAQWLRDHQRT